MIRHDNSVRLCVDFRKINALTPQLQTYLPCLDDILLKVGSSTVLSTIDLAKRFHQVVLEPSSRQYTTISVYEISLAPLADFSIRVYLLA